MIDDKAARTNFHAVIREVFDGAFETYARDVSAVKKTDAASAPAAENAEVDEDADKADDKEKKAAGPDKEKVGSKIAIKWGSNPIPISKRKAPSGGRGGRGGRNGGGRGKSEGHHSRKQMLMKSV